MPTSADINRFLDSHRVDLAAGIRDTPINRFAVAHRRLHPEVHEGTWESHPVNADARWMH